MPALSIHFFLSLPVLRLLSSFFILADVFIAPFYIAFIPYIFHSNILKKFSFSLYSFLPSLTSFCFFVSFTLLSFSFSPSSPISSFSFTLRYLSRWHHKCYNHRLGLLPPCSFPMGFESSLITNYNDLQATLGTVNQ